MPFSLINTANRLRSSAPFLLLSSGPLTTASSLVQSATTSPGHSNKRVKLSLPSASDSASQPSSPAQAAFPPMPKPVPFGPATEPATVELSFSQPSPVKPDSAPKVNGNALSSSAPPHPPPPPSIPPPPLPPADIVELKRASALRSIASSFQPASATPARLHLRDSLSFSPNSLTKIEASRKALLLARKAAIDQKNADAVAAAALAAAELDAAREKERERKGKGRMVESSPEEGEIDDVAMDAPEFELTDEQIEQELSNIRAALGPSSSLPSAGTDENGQDDVEMDLGSDDDETETVRNPSLDDNSKEESLAVPSGSNSYRSRQSPSLTPFSESPSSTPGISPPTATLPLPSANSLSSSINQDLSDYERQQLYKKGVNKRPVALDFDSHPATMSTSTVYDSRSQTSIQRHPLVPDQPRRFVIDLSDSEHGDDSSDEDEDDAEDFARSGPSASSSKRVSPVLSQKLPFVAVTTESEADAEARKRLEAKEAEIQKMMSLIAAMEKKQKKRPTSLQPGATPSSTVTSTIPSPTAQILALPNLTPSSHPSSADSALPTLPNAPSVMASEIFDTPTSSTDALSVAVEQLHEVMERMEEEREVLNERVQADLEMEQANEMTVYEESGVQYEELVEQVRLEVTKDDAEEDEIEKEDEVVEEAEEAVDTSVKEEPKEEVEDLGVPAKRGSKLVEIVELDESEDDEIQIGTYLPSPLLHPFPSFTTKQIPV
jgi:hypothetical protein